MNTYKLDGNTWKEFQNITLSEDEIKLQKTGEGTKAEKDALQVLLNSRWKGVTATVKAELDAKLLSIKPAGTVAIIDCGIDNSSIGYTGLLNCTVNGEYKQIRF